MAVGGSAEGTGLRSQPLRGLVYMAGAGFCLTLLDAAVKWLTTDYTPPQIAFIRYGIGICLAAAIATRAGGIGTLRTQRPLGHLLRSVLNLGTMLTFYYALARLPLANAMAIGYAAPLFMTVLSVPMLRERVGPRRWTAVLIGFIGVVVILRPSEAGLDIGSLLALLSALLYALTLITSRQLSGTESSHTILFYYSIAVLVATGAAMPWLWVTPRWNDLWIFVIAGVAGSAGQYFLNQAFRYGEVSLLAPVEYVTLLWATLFGFAIWGQLPGAATLSGAAIIIASTLYIVQREARLRRAVARGMP
jgi:drug/metabolite transporter (DMT)-like permease